MRGVTYQEYQDRWKVSHTTSEGIQIQAYFMTIIEAVKEKLMLCKTDNTTPMSKANKRKDCLDKSLPVGLCDCTKLKHRMIVSQVVTMGGKILRKESKYSNEKGRVRAIKKVSQWRQGQVRSILLNAARAYGVNLY